MDEETNKQTNKEEEMQSAEEKQEETVEQEETVVPEETSTPEVVPQPAARPAYVQFILPGAILLAALIISGTLIFVRGGGTAQIAGSKPEKVEIKINSDDHILGDKKAKITMVEFSDFQCPFCRSFWSQTLPQIKKEYIDTGKVRFVYKHYPLSFHPAAQPAAEASECAAEQDKFWEFHDKIFQEQEKLGQGTITFGEKEIKNWASAIGLDMTQLNECIDSGRYTEKVSQDQAQGSQLDVKGTPTMFINGQRVVGALPFASFKTVIDQLLK